MHKFQGGQRYHRDWNGELLRRVQLRSSRLSAPLPFPPISDILSDTKTFTVRELDRKPSVELDTCEREGAVRIRRCDGRSYTVRPDEPPARKLPWRRLVEEHRARIARIFPEPLNKKQVRLVDQLIAGE